MAMLQPKPSSGLKLDSIPERPDRVPLEKGEYSVASRALALSTYFLSGALAINLSQILGTPLYLVNQDWYNAWIAFTKQSFGLLTMTLTQAFAPTKVIVSGDASVRGQLSVTKEGNLVLNFPNRIILMANHQIYTDWLYLWWIAYCNGMHGRLYIILKESLKSVPILGWGMQLSQFIFLKRNWEKDKPHMASALNKLNKASEPMWLMLFPEGTNLAPSTREKSAAWAAKNNMKDMLHTLLPRSTGLQFCLQQLSSTVEYLYDCTVAYEGVPRGQYAQDIFTLKAGYLEGRPPKSVHMYWRRYALKDIPFHNDKAFELWLVARWREKDLLIENYLRTGKFPADNGATKLASGKIARGTGHSTVQIRSSHWYEFLQIFAPMGVLAMILAVFYGALPKSFWNNFNKQAMKSNAQDIKQVSRQAGTQVKQAGTAVSGLTLDDIFDKDKQEDSFKKGAVAVQQWLGTPQAQTMMNRVDFVGQFLKDPEQTVRDTVKGQRKDFMHAIEEEEQRRRRLKLPDSTKNVGVQKGRFWDDLNRLENSRHGSVISDNSSNKPAGTFWADLQDAERRKKGQGLDYGVKGGFWDKMKSEENTRYGSVRTVSSSAGLSNMGTVRTIPSTPASTRAPSMIGGPISRRPSAPPSTISGVRSNAPPVTARPQVKRASSTISSAPSVAGSKKATSAAVKPPAATKPATAPPKRPNTVVSKPASKAPASNTPSYKPAAASKPTPKKPASTAASNPPKPNPPRPKALASTTSSKTTTPSTTNTKKSTPSTKPPTKASLAAKKPATNGVKQPSSTPALKKPSPTSSASAATAKKQPPAKPAQPAQNAAKKPAAPAVKKATPPKLGTNGNGMKGKG
jgi:1-acyl-sn-glycerol-3-phosphate acyltransferase